MQHPIFCNVISELLTPFLKSFQDSFVEGIIDQEICPGGKHFLWIITQLSKKIIVIIFTLDLLMHTFFGQGEFFMCHSSLCRFISGLYSNTQILSLFSKFLTGSLFAQRQVCLNTSFGQIFCKWNDLLEFCELHFYPSLFLLQSLLYLISGLSLSQLTWLPQFDHVLARLAFQSKVHLKHFLIPFWKLCAT